MTLFMPDPSSAWDRTLPTPSAILQNIPTGTLSRRSSSLLQHHLVSHDSQELLSSDVGRRSTVPCISYHERRSSVPEGAQMRMVDSSSGEPAPYQSTPLGTLTRKRDASHMADESLSGPESPSGPITGDGAKEFCLCQPDPKIPRPRNAFILFRQHQQAAVVTSHPGLPNPEISKIIGEQWRSLEEESKNEWKALAEEEKSRHQQQYPEYRYQPRRNGRYSNTSSVSGASAAQAATVSEQGTCLKCFGKVMNPPNTPYNPFPAPAPSAPPPGLMNMQQPRRAFTVTAGPQRMRPSMNVAVTSPRSTRVRPYAEVFGRQPQHDPRQPQHDPRLRYAGQQPPPSPYSPESSKRRRFNGQGVLIPNRGDVYPQQGQQYSAPMARPEMMQGPRTAMAPPPRNMYPPASVPPQMPQMQPMQQVRPGHPPDPSLVLPPLKTVTGPQSPPQTQKSGIEAMIKSIAPLNKLKFLTQISPQLSSPSVASPPFEVRGAILAVEGLDPASVWNMANSLAEQLERDGKFAVRIFGGPDPYEDVRRSRSSGKEKSMTMETFLGIISQWHRISKEMIDYITTKPKLVQFHTTELEGRPEDPDTQMAEASAVQAPDSAVSPRTMNKAAELSLISPVQKLPTVESNETLTVTTINNLPARTSSRRTPPTPPPVASTSDPRIPSPAHSATKPNPSPAHGSISQQVSLPNVLPIALIPHYQLTTVDASAIALPITDAYSPLSHWQWLATLWRGCVGPDVSVVVEDVNDAVGSSRSSLSGNSLTEGLAEGVEVRLSDARAIVVRLGLDAKAMEGEGWEKAKRRVGFEVEEYLRR